MGKKRLIGSRSLTAISRPLLASWTSSCGSLVVPNVPPIFVFTSYIPAECHLQWHIRIIITFTRQNLSQVQTQNSPRGQPESGEVIVVSKQKQKLFYWEVSLISRRSRQRLALQGLRREEEQPELKPKLRNNWNVHKSEYHSGIITRLIMLIEWWLNLNL